MNKLVLLLGAAAAVFYATKGSTKVAPVPATNPLSTTTTSNPAGGPVFPATDRNASAAVPAGQMVYVNTDGVRFWHYVDANGFEHYVIGLNDAAFITNESCIVMDRRTGEKASNDNARRPSLDTPVAININLGGLRGAGRPASILKTLG